MAQFMAVIQGQRGEASRLGSAKSGIRANVNGWRSGIRVNGYANREGRDVFAVYATGGSGHGRADVSLGSLAFDADGNLAWYPAPQAAVLQPYRETDSAEM